MTNQEECEKINLRNENQKLSDENEKLKRENKKLQSEKDDLTLLLQSLKDMKKKSKYLIGVFILLSIVMGTFLIKFNDNVGTFVLKTKIIPNEFNRSSPILETSPVQIKGEKGYLRDSTPIVYSFLFFLFLIVLILFFEYKKYEALKDE